MRIYTPPFGPLGKDNFPPTQNKDPFLIRTLPQDLIVPISKQFYLEIGNFIRSVLFRNFCELFILQRFPKWKTSLSL